MREIEYNELCYDSDISNLEDNFSEDAIGQERAIEAISLGLKIKRKGYNILTVGKSGCGRTAFAKKLAEEAAAKEAVPEDICYVYNFKKPKEPMLLSFKAGGGREFKNEISELIHTLTVELPKAYTSVQYESEKELLLKEIQNRRENAVKQISDNAREQGFSVKNENGGLKFTPIIDGKVISDEEYDCLDKEERDRFTKKSDAIIESADEYIKEIKEAEGEIKKEIDDMEYNMGLFTVGRYFSPLQEKYVDNPRVTEYLVNLKEDILANIDLFSDVDSDDGEDMMAAIMPWTQKKGNDEALRNYEVNLFVDNEGMEGAPVITCYNPNYCGLAGEVEFDNEYGNYVTDYTKIMPGLLHKANGGYIILQLSDVLASPFVWETIKKVLKTGEIAIEPVKDYQFSGVSLTTLKPEPVKFNGKIIMVCSGYYYELLKAYDDDTDKLFKISAFFDYEMNDSRENLGKFVGYLKNYHNENDTKPIDMSAAGELIKASKRLCGRKDKLSSEFAKINDIITEADAYAAEDNSGSISAEHIKKAVFGIKRRISIYEDKLDEMFEEGDMLIDVCGSKAGQINGLSVIEAYGNTFGRPSRITASTYMGKAGVINIEKESKLSGEIHTKGVMVLGGYIGREFAGEFPLSFSCRLCFEQNYGGVDGDSASSAEAYAILSSLADVGIKQNFAVTGSINQFGEIQPIGGVTYKVEGFYDVCKRKGLNGEQGVIIPKHNIKELVLRDDVIDAVKEGKFHIYAIESVDEGIELLTGLKACEVKNRAFEKLKSYYKKSKEE